MSAQRRRWPLLLGALLLLAIGAGAWLHHALGEPRTLARWLVAAAAREGLALRLEGDAAFEYRPWPTLTLRGVDARDRVSGAPILRAQRLRVSVPWATLLRRSPALGALRLEAPRIEQTGLARWLETRPHQEGALRWPRLAAPIEIVDGTFVPAAGEQAWTNVAISLDRLQPGQRSRLRARASRDGASWALELDGVPADSAEGRTLSLAPLRITRDESSLSLEGQAEIDARKVAGALRARHAGKALDGRIDLAAVSAPSLRFDGRYADAPVRLEATLPEWPRGPEGWIDAIAGALVARGTIERIDLGGAVLEGVRIRAAPEAADDTAPESRP